jgi:hypothetical protein
MGRFEVTVTSRTEPFAEGAITKGYVLSGFGAMLASIAVVLLVVVVVVTALVLGYVIAGLVIAVILVAILVALLRTAFRALRN